MQNLKTRILTLVVIVEAIAIIVLVTTQKRLAIVYSDPAVALPNRLQLALEYESPDKKFEELVHRYPHLMSMRTSVKGSINSPILASCAILNRTNYVKILIENGADVEEAVNFLQTVEAKDAIDLLRQVQSESKSKTSD